VLVIVITAVSFWLEKKKREAFTRLAAALGLSYHPEKNYQLAERFTFLNMLNQGSSHYVQHCLSGTLGGQPILAFEHHYQTESSNSKGQRSVQHHYTAVFTTPLPKSFPELTIRPEGVLSKIAQAFGYADIDFESAEFSRRYCVRSRDKKFAYDICHPLAMEFLLKHHDLEIEIEGTILAALKPGNLELETFASSARRLLAFRQLIPEYLLKS
jgi:hypothetical protein